MQVVRKVKISRAAERLPFFLGAAVSQRLRITLDSNIIPIIVLLAAASVVYLNTLYNGFVYDDEFIIVNNIWIRDFSHIPEIFSSHLWGFKLGSDSNYYRPFVHLILMAEYYIFELLAWPYHLVNLLAHSANTILVYLIAIHLLEAGTYGQRVVELPAPGASIESNTRLIAFGGGLLFAVHPVHVEAVAPASVVAELSLSFCYLASLYLYMRSCAAPANTGRAVFYIVSLCLSALGIFLKETAVTLIAVLFAYDLIMGRSFRLNPRSMLRCGLRYTPYLLVVLLYILTRMHFLGGFAPFKQNAQLTIYQCFLNIPLLFAEYLRLLFYPAGLNVFYTFHPVLSMGEYDVLVLLPFLFFVPIFFFLLIRRNRLALFCIFLAVLALSPALYIPGVGVKGNAFAERYLYVPSAGFSILISSFIYWSLTKIRRPAVPSQRCVAFLIIIAVITVSFSTQTILRNRVWESNYTLWKDAAEKTKDSKVVYVNYGSAAGAKGYHSEAIEAYRRAYEIAPDSPEIFNNLGMEYLELGRLDNALAAFKKALSLTSNPGSVVVIKKNLGDVYLKKGMLDDALREYSEVLLIVPESKFIAEQAEWVKRLRDSRR